MTCDERVNKREFDALFKEMLKIVPPLKSILKGGRPTLYHEQRKIKKLLLKLAKIKPISDKPDEITNGRTIPKIA